MRCLDQIARSTCDCSLARRCAFCESLRFLLLDVALPVHRHVASIHVKSDIIHDYDIQCRTPGVHKCLSGFCRNIHYQRQASSASFDVSILCEGVCVCVSACDFIGNASHTNTTRTRLRARMSLHPFHDSIVVAHSRCV